jgi:hypothetical protein
MKIRSFRWPAASLLAAVVAVEVPARSTVLFLVQDHSLPDRLRWRSGGRQAPAR